MEQPTTSVNGQSVANVSLLQKTSSLLIEFEKIRLWAYPAAIGVVYVLGFIVANAHLVKAGVVELDFANARYFIAGLNFVLYLVVFYLFAGRAVLHGKKWLVGELDYHYKRGGGPKWAVVITLSSYVHLFFFCCMSSAAFASVAFEGHHSAWFYLFLLLPFLVIYAFDVTNLDVKYPKVFRTLKIFFEGGGIVIFFITPINSELLLGIFFGYLGLLLLINVILDKFERYRTTADDISFAALYFFFSLIGSSALYGATIYGNIRPQVGGAAPETVTIGVTEDARKALVEALANPLQLFTGKLIHQTQTHLYLAIGDKTVRLRGEDVLLVVTKPHVEKKLGEYISEEMTGYLNRKLVQVPASNSNGLPVPAPKPTIASDVQGAHN